MLNVTSSKVCLLSVIIFTFVPILYMSSKGCLLYVFVFIFVPILYMLCQARAVYSLCFHFCPHITHVMPSKDSLLSLFSRLSSCYRPPCCTKHCLLSADIKIKRSSAFLIIFVFVVSWQHVSLDWVYLCGCKCMLCTVCLAYCICVCKPTVGYFMQDCICVCKPTVHDTR